MTSKTYSYINGHFNAIRLPTRQEKPLVDLLSALGEIMAKEDGDDEMLKDMVIIPLIQATQAYLDWDHGDRLDKGALDAMLLAAAKDRGIPDEAWCNPASDT